MGRTTGTRNQGQTLKRILNKWGRDETTNGPNTWQFDKDDD